MTIDEFRNLPDPPGKISAANGLSRLVDSIAFRFFWVTENLDPEVYKFAPCASCRSISDLLIHIWDLLNWVRSDLALPDIQKPLSDQEYRASILQLCTTLRIYFLDLEDEKLEQLRFMDKPFWILLNGALADVLTHLGQIGTIRRIAGSPSPKSDPFQGIPPADQVK